MLLRAQHSPLPGPVVVYPCNVHFIGNLSKPSQSPLGSAERSQRPVECCSRAVCHITRVSCLSPSLSVCLSVCLSPSLSATTHGSAVCLAILMSVSLSVSTLSIFLSVSLSVSPCLPGCLSVSTLCSPCLLSAYLPVLSQCV